MVFFDKLVLTFFFFQAEDGIRDLTVTGVQTCALPIAWRSASAAPKAPLTTPRGFIGASRASSRPAVPPRKGSPPFQSFPNSPAPPPPAPPGPSPAPGQGGRAHRGPPPHHAPPCAPA